jgi:hypothetical protein
MLVRIRSQFEAALHEDLPIFTTLNSVDWNTACNTFLVRSEQFAAVNMNKASVVHLKAAEASQGRPTEAAPVRAERAGWRKLSFFPTRQPTALQRCPALHLFIAERKGAMD